MPAGPENLELFTPEQRAAIWDRVTSWLGPDETADAETGTQRMTIWLERQVAFQTIASAMIASGEVVLPGRNGISIMARALKDFPGHAERLLEIIRGEEGK